ncbi:MAG: hypothetical protein CMH56_01820 [Myxococcales bacterium]|nr:hypothetical protein [Myxococcales bacterium]
MRDEWDGGPDQVAGFVHLMLEAGRQAAELPLKKGVHALQMHIARLQKVAPSFSQKDVAMLHFAAQNAWAPRHNNSEHVQQMRKAGFSDLEIHDVTHVVCCFSYMNRLADALGVTSPESQREWGNTLFGQGGFDAHLAWAKDHGGYDA